MKIGFKVMSVLMIIWAAAQIVLGAIALIGSGAILGAASEVGGGMGAVAGAAGLITSIFSIAAIVVAALMVYTGVNGFREIYSKCQKFTLGFIIFTGITLVLAIFTGTSAGSTLIQLIFFIVYFILAKKCEEDEGSFNFY